ncbi:hypothetical protein ACN6K6_002507, partial [Streptomyces violaceoruber]
MRVAALSLGLVGALALTACTDGGDSDGGGSGEGSGGDKSSAAPGASASTDPGGDAGGSPSAGAAGELEGSWLATTDGQAVALMVTGDKAALFATGGTVCSGTTEETSGTRTIRLKCADGSADRATGKVPGPRGRLRPRRPGHRPRRAGPARRRPRHRRGHR